MYRVLVLMSSYNGEKYIKDQIYSILTQENIDVDLVVRDDGSSDKTLSILKECQDKGLLKFYTGSNLRPAKSFMNLLINSNKNYDYYAFSDQDDIWKSNKIIKAIDFLERDEKHDKKVYFSNLTRTDSELNIIEEFVIDNNKVKLDYYTLLTNCGYIFGCTMVMNKKFVDFIKEIGEPKDLIMHDIWLSLICSLYGRLYYDKESYILYRQHNNNFASPKESALKKIVLKMKYVISGGNLPMYITAKNLLLIMGKYPVDKEVLLQVESVSHYADSLGNKLNFMFRQAPFKDGFKRGLFRMLCIMTGKL